MSNLHSLRCENERKKPQAWNKTHGARTSMGLVWRLSHHINFLVGPEHYRHNWTCANVIMGYATLKI